MTPAPPVSRLALAGVLGAVALGLGWLMFGYANERSGLVVLTPQGDARQLAEVSGLPDPANAFTLEKIRALAPEAWKAPRRAAIYFHGGEPLWLRVTLRNPGDTPVDGVLSTGCYFIDRLEAWLEGPETPGPLAHQVTGERSAERTKTIRSREAAVAVRLAARSERVVLLRLTDASGGSLQLGWWPEARDFFTAQSHQLLAEGLYFGGLFALLGYNLVLWLRLRFADTGCYVLYLGTVLAFMLLARGLAAVPGWAPGSPTVDTLVVVVTIASAFCLAQFARLFLQLGGRFPRADRLVRAWQAVLAVLAAGALSVPWTSYSRWMTVACGVTAGTHALLLLLAARAWRAGERPARFFVLSFGCLFAGTAPLILEWLSGAVVPDAGMFGLMIGSALEMLLLSLAVADRFVQAQAEKTAAQARLLEETEQRRAIEEAYADELEVEVRERTRELEEVNADKDRMLTVLAHDLRSPLASLTQAAKQILATPADAGRSARFATSTEQVGREALLLIEDLVLWARLRNAAPAHAGRHEVRMLVAPVASLHQTVARQHEVEVIVKIPEPLAVCTDLVLAQTLLRNLVANALKFARSRVEVAATEREGRVRLSVADDGHGLPDTVAVALQQRTALPVGAAGGLGLRLCLEISRALGTELELRTSASGTEFGFLLPVAPSEGVRPA